MSQSANLPESRRITSPISSELLVEWRDRGFIIVRKLFDQALVEDIRDRFDQLAREGQPVDGHWAPALDTDDPLARYPRVMHPHRFDELSRKAMLHPAIRACLRDLMGQEPVACQSMYYFKPPQSPGQALHQDNFYLAVRPGTCIAAWTAIDQADPENGGMYMVPESHRLDVICPDVTQKPKKNGSNLVDPPPGMKAEPTHLEPGDTIFFNGSVIHGSGRNRSETRWRRSFISHYMPAGSTHVSAAYFPILDFSGREISFEAAGAGGPCGEALAAYAGTYGVDATIH
ncbi:MAG: phytanoyl-CoA dioxygenase family protein [Phycisphaeraceae bacterium]|nr:phytanoyl-CoA dioxygenase family protein [Phycisphaeraceae bacterium]